MRGQQQMPWSGMKPAGDELSKAWQKSEGYMASYCYTMKKGLLSARPHYWTASMRCGASLRCFFVEQQLLSNIFNFIEIYRLFCWNERPFSLSGVLTNTKKCYFWTAAFIAFNQSHSCCCWCWIHFRTDFSDLVKWDSGASIILPFGSCAKYYLIPFAERECLHIRKYGHVCITIYLYLQLLWILHLSKI